MKYIKNIIDFNNWDEIDNSFKEINEYHINDNIKNIFQDFINFLINNNIYDKYINELEESWSDYKISFFNTTKPEDWISSAFGWYDDYNIWLSLHEKWIKSNFIKNYYQ